jgi:hypothetical protein
MKRLAAILLIVVGVVSLASAPASARPYGWYGYRPYYRAYYGPRPYWGAYYRYPGYRAFYPGVAVGVGYGFGYPAAYGYYGAPYYGYPANYGYPGAYYGW